MTPRSLRRRVGVFPGWMRHVVRERAAAMRPRKHVATTTSSHAQHEFVELLAAPRRRGTGSLQPRRGSRPQLPGIAESARPAIAPAPPTRLNRPAAGGVDRNKL